MEDAVATALQNAMPHLELKGSYCQVIWEFHTPVSVPNSKRTSAIHGGHREQLQISFSLCIFRIMSGLTITQFVQANSIKLNWLTLVKLGELD